MSVASELHTISDVHFASEPIWIWQYHQFGLTPLIRAKIQDSSVLSMLTATLFACWTAQIRLQRSIYENVWVSSPTAIGQSQAKYFSDKFCCSCGINYAKQVKGKSLEPYANVTEDEFMGQAIDMMKHHMDGLMPIIEDRITHLTDDPEILENLQMFAGLNSALILVLQAARVAAEEDVAKTCREFETEYNVPDTVVYPPVEFYSHCDFEVCNLEEMQLAPPARYKFRDPLSFEFFLTTNVE